MIIRGHNHPTTVALYEKLIGLPVEWFRSPDGRRLLAKSLRLVRRVAGRAEAVDLRDNLYLAVGATDGYSRIGRFKYPEVFA